MNGLKSISAGSAKQSTSSQEDPVHAKQPSSYWSRLWPFSKDSSAAPLQERIGQVTAEPRVQAVAAQTLKLPERTTELSMGDLLRDMGQKIYRYQTPPDTDVSIDWRVKTNQELDDFIRKASMFATLTMMDSDISSALSSEIIREACETNRSIHDLYMEKKGDQLTFSGRLSVKFTYFFYYYCPIIPNVIDECAKFVLEEMRSKLVQKDGGKNLTLLVDQFLQRTDSFLADYLKALRAYGNGEGKGSRDSYLTEQLEQPVDAICQKFANTAIDDLLPERIPFFKRWEKSDKLAIRLLGNGFAKILEPLLNKILKKILRKKIPEWTKSLVQTSSDAAQQKNLPFAVSITKGILDQLRKFKAQVVDGKFTPAAAPNEVSGTERLPEVINQLLEVLRLEPYKSRKELSAHLDTKSSNPFSSQISKGIEQSLIDGARTFLSYLSDPEHSEELFYQLLNFSNIPFTAKAPSTPDEWKELENTYEEAKSQMRSEASDLFKTLIHRSVSTEVHGLSEKDLEVMSNRFCKTQRDRLQKTASLLRADVASMQQKMKKLALNPRGVPLLSPPEESTLPDLDSLVSRIDAYRTQEALEDRSLFPQSIQMGIEHTMMPIYLRLDDQINAAIAARDLQIKMTSSSLVAQEIKTISDQLQQCSLDLSNPGVSIWSACRNALERMRAEHGETDTQAAPFQKSIDLLESLHDSYRKETLAMQSLHELGKKDALLSQTAKAKQAKLSGKHSSFSWRRVRSQIAIACRSLPQQEGKTILALADRFHQSKSQSDLKERWKALSDEVRAIYSKHDEEKKRLATAFEENQRTALEWVAQELKEVESDIQKSHEDLLTKIAILDSSLVDVEGRIESIQPMRMETLDAKLIRKMGGPASVATGVAGAAAGLGLSYFLGPYTPLLLGAIGGTVSALRTKGSAILGRTFAGSAIGAAVGMVPYVNAVAAPAILGAGGTAVSTAATKLFTDRVIYPEVQEIFNHMYAFALQPHVWKLVIIGSIDSINNAYKK